MTPKCRQRPKRIVVVSLELRTRVPLTKLRAAAWWNMVTGLTVEQAQANVIQRGRRR